VVVASFAPFEIVVTQADVEAARRSRDEAQSSLSDASAVARLIEQFIVFEKIQLGAIRLAATSRSLSVAFYTSVVGPFFLVWASCLATVAFNIAFNIPLPTGLWLILAVPAGLLGLLAASLLLPRVDSLHNSAQSISMRLKESAFQRAAAHRDQQKALERFRCADERFQNLNRILGTERNSLLSENWRVLTGTEFEKFLGRVFACNGYEVQLTKASGDHGVDLIVVKDGRRAAVQAKGYPNTTVGNSAVQEVFLGMRMYHCDVCIVVTNSTFTRAAREAASSANCLLIDQSGIQDVITGRYPIL